MAAFADDHEPQMRGQVRHRPGREIDALVLLEPRDRQHVVAVVPVCKLGAISGGW